MNKLVRVTAAAIAAFSLTATAACSSSGGGGEGDGGSGEPVTLEYWLWDDLQAPLYQACADSFTAANPNITVNLTQTAWAQYWQNLTTQITAGSAPDVFTNQISYFAQFVETNQVLDLTPYVEASEIDLTAYTPGTPERWVLDGKRYGLPKDWDTVGLLYNVEVATEAGYSAEDIAALEWNPTDGGTFEEFIRAMAEDAQGRDGNDPAFDAGDVVRYGYYPEWGDGAVGQNGWGNFAHANGFTFTDDQGIPTTFNYDSPELAETATWFQSMIQQGIAPQFDAQSSLGTQAVMENGDAAATVAGSWLASTYLDESATVEFAFAPVPAGPEGRFAASNGLSDAVWAGTDHPEEAYEWVEYLASAECQEQVAEAGVIFPALTSATEIALAAREEQGIDSSAFVDRVEAGETFAIPVFQQASEVNLIVQDAMQAIAQGAPAQPTLAAADQEVEALFR